MSRIRPTQKIYDIAKEIKEDMYKLPNIQRSFVWEEERVCKLMDSLMNGYPIGSFLVWKPSSNLTIRTRKFTQDYKPSERPISELETQKSIPYLVLDGQQRLQSLYLVFFGKYDNKYLYFKVNSNPSKEENGLRYHFQFMVPDEANKDIHWRRVAEIVQITIPKISQYVDNEFREDPSDVKERIKENIGKFIQVFCMDERIHIQEVEENLSYNDVLEVFVRVNSGGIVLTKSDLLFSTVILHSPKMEENFIELVDEINGNGEYDFNTDFLIKSSFVILDKGAKYDIEKLKDGDYIKNLEDNFERFKKALLSTMDFLKTDAKILSKRFLKSDLAIIPIIDFIYQQPHQQLPEGQATNLKQYLYMSFFMRFYSYGPDGKLDVIHKKIRENSSLTNFPIDEISKYMAERTGMNYAFADKMLHDFDLTLNIIQGGVSEIPKKRGLSLEQDHIFPKKVLEEKGIPNELINSIGNLRYIKKIRNILKGATLPEENTEFFGSDDPMVKRLFNVARANLTERTFKEFVEKRRDIIMAKVNDFLGFKK